MLLLSDLVGTPVRLAGGEVVGTLVDLRVSFHDDEPPVETLVVRVDRRRTIEIAVDAVEQFRGGTVLVAPGPYSAIDDPGNHLGRQDLLLVRDVLDTQIYDIAGGRLARVSDIHVRVAPSGVISVVAVDTSFGSVCRRLGLRRLGERLDDEIVDWSVLHLTSARGHAVQLQTTRAALHRMDTTQLAALLTRVSTRHGAEIATAVAPDRTAAALATAAPEVGERILGAIGDEQAEAVIEALPPSRAQAAQFWRRHPEQVRRRLLRHRPRRRHRPGSGPESASP